jgi:hypothetical protein
VHLVPGWGTRAGKIKTAGAILFDRSRLRKKRVKLPIMAEYDPTFCGYFAYPFIIRSSLIEAKFVSRIVVIFN